ncbi:beta-glucosidase 34 isoform X2 [Cryptomeria japonica]|uniref:beta-glucosidase 34 isoform X2 n=1 Tax=Cryptomeria japonica TaxID=3369 RepID=UPI0027DA45C5|nr:beta-glucosidase 34 isoform X2 [Cryptomeria japonica]
MLASFLFTKMGFQGKVRILLTLLSSIMVVESALNRKSFPQGFTFGSSSSAYQFEGAVAKDGRMPSICDTYYDIPSHTLDGSNANVTVNQYYLYPEDIKMMAKVGFDAYRFSISWSRLIPGIEPYVTISHFDIPQALEDEYGGWLDRRIIDDFANYAEVCFNLFGDRVKHWITINEPNLEASIGYDLGVMPPGRCSAPFGNCTQGNSTTEPYIAAHYQLLSHAAAVARLRKNEARKNSSVGFPINQFWYEPLTNSSEDLEAQQRALEFTVGWIFDPIFFGDYPSSMRKRVGERLPKFTEDEVEMLKGSIDFIGLNHYGSLYATDKNSSSTIRDYYADMAVELTGVRDGVPIGPKTAFESSAMILYIVPRGIKLLVEYVKNRYNSPEIFILENGVATEYNETIKEELNDTIRVNFHHDYLVNLLEAIEDGANVKGYFVWSFLDNFELGFGFTLRFGLTYVDFKNHNLPRYSKLSSLWFHQFLTSNTTSLQEKPNSTYIQRTYI